MTNRDESDFYTSVTFYPITYFREAKPDCVDMNYTFGAWKIRYTYWGPSDIKGKTNSKSQILIFKDNAEIAKWTNNEPQNSIYAMYKTMLRNYRYGLLINPNNGYQHQ